MILSRGSIQLIWIVRLRGSLSIGLGVAAETSCLPWGKHLPFLLMTRLALVYPFFLNS